MKTRLKNTLITSLFTVAALAAPAAFADETPKPMNFGAPEALAIVSNNTRHEFQVEIADDSAEQARGMMFRDVVEPDTGMLFEFGGSEIRSIWMKNTSVFLDVLFVREDGRIVKVVHSAKPYSLRSMSSEFPVAAVLELAGGQVSELGIQTGDIVEHEFFGNAQK